MAHNPRTCTPCWFQECHRCTPPCAHTETGHYDEDDE